MKWKRTLLLWILIVCSLYACTGISSGQMYIEQTESAAEDELFAEFAASSPQHATFRFSVDSTVKSIHIHIYELIDGQWQDISGGTALKFTDSEGHLFLGFSSLPDGFQTAVQGSSGADSSSHSGDRVDMNGLCSAYTLLDRQENILFDQEIPLAIQIFSSTDHVNAYGPEHFSQPGKIAEDNYEHVYAITVKFSQKPAVE